MADHVNHNRRDFLQGKAAVKTLVDRAQAWLDNTSEFLASRQPSVHPLHLHASRRAMACEFAIQFHEDDRHATDDILDAFDMIEGIEDQLTIYRDQSTVIDINRRAAYEAVAVESDLFRLLEQAVSLTNQTERAFDITSTPLSRIWGFLQRDGRVPEQEEIEKALELVGIEKVELDSLKRTVRFTQPGVEINFNSIGKGYALDNVAHMLTSHGVSDYLWHGGSSSVLARGRNRTEDSDCWSLGLRHPTERERRIVEFYLRDRALATAGGATQFFEHQGQRYSHILDPRTGWPAKGVTTATVLAPTAAEADALATAFFVMGVEAVEQFCSNRPEIGALLVCQTAGSEEFTLHAIGLDSADWTQLAPMST